MREGESISPKSMRTLQIGNDWPGERVGGLNRYFVELLRHLPETGTEVRGMVVGPASIGEETHGSVLPFARSRDPIYRRVYRARRAALEQIRSGSIDLVSSHFALYAPPSGAWSKQIPMVVHFHGPWSAESNVEGSRSREQWVKHRLERGVYRRARRLIVLSRSFQRELVSRFGVDEELTRIVPGGIDVDRFNMSMTRAEARERLGWPRDRPILLAVRRMVRRMGLENLIDAVRVAAASCPDVLLLLGGAGPLAADLHKRISEGGLERHVRLLGRIDEADLALAYRAADMTVVPTQALEGFGMITLESLASGTPVLVTPVGGLPEVVEPFAPECVFADASTETMAHVLVEILGERLRLPTDDACRAYALDRFAWPRIAREVRDVYDEAKA